MEVNYLLALHRMDTISGNIGRKNNGDLISAAFQIYQYCLLAHFYLIQRIY